MINSMKLQSKLVLIGLTLGLSSVLGNASQRGAGSPMACDVVRTEVLFDAQTREKRRAALSVKEQKALDKGFLVAVEKRKYVETMQFLNAGASTYAIYKSGWTALMMAAFRGYTKIGALLIAAGSTLDVQSDDGTALMIAASKGQAEFVTLLVDAGAEVNSDGSCGRTALMTAARGSYTEVVRLLIEAGAKINTEDYDDDTPLIFAVRDGHRADSVALHILAGADKTSSNWSYRAALSYATDPHTHELLTAGSDEVLIKLLTSEERQVCKRMLANRALRTNCLVGALRVYELFDDSKFLRLFLEKTNLRHTCARKDKKRDIAIDSTTVSKPLQAFEGRLGLGLSGSEVMTPLCFGSQGIYEYVYGPEQVMHLKRLLTAALEKAHKQKDKKLFAELADYGAPLTEDLRASDMTKEWLEGVIQKNKMVVQQELKRRADGTLVSAAGIQGLSMPVMHYASATLVPVSAGAASGSTTMIAQPGKQDNK